MLIHEKVYLRNNPFLPVVCGPIYHGLEFRSEIIRSRRRRRSDLIISLLNDKPWYIGPQTTGKNGLFRFYHDFFIALFLIILFICVMASKHVPFFPALNISLF